MIREPNSFLFIFFSFLKEWRAQPHLNAFANKHIDEHHFVMVPDDDPMQTQYQKIPMRGGSLLIWNGLQPHCNYSNNSNR